MAVTVTVTPTSPVGKSSVCKFALAGLTLNDATAYDVDAVPTEPEVRYYMTFVLGGTEYGRTQEFACDSTGAWLFDDYIFPAAGSWSAVVHKHDGTTVKTQAVTVS